MPKSKRTRVVDLTQTKAKGADHKQEIIATVREAVETYPNVFVFQVRNMQVNKFQKLREVMKNGDTPQGRFIQGSNKVMQIALGRTPESAIRPGMDRISECLKGNTGLLATSWDREAVEKLFEDAAIPAFAHAGDIATQNITIAAGPNETLPGILEQQLRNLGCPTKLFDGKVIFLYDYDVCKAGEELTSQAAQIVKLLGIMMSEFRVELVAECTGDGQFTLIKEPQVSASE